MSFRLFRQLHALCAKPTPMHLSETQARKLFILIVAAYDAGAAKHKLQDTLDTDLQRGLRVANMEQKSTRN